MTMIIAKSAPMKSTINATATCCHTHGVDWANVGDWVSIGDWVSVGDWVNVEYGVNVGHVVGLFIISV